MTGVLGAEALPEKLFGTQGGEIPGYHQKPQLVPAAISSISANLRQAE